MPENMKAPPQFLEGERAILGAILIEEAILPSIANKLTPNDFYREAHRNIFRAMLELYNRNERVDWITLTAILRDQGILEAIGGHGFLAELSDAVPSAANVMHYVKHVRNKSYLRQVIAGASEVASKCYGEPEDIGEIQACLQQIAFDVSRDTTISAGPRHIKEVLKDRIVDLESACETGILSGLSNLDSITMGFRRGDFIIIAGRPSMGKTALLADIVDAAVRQTAILIFTIEMSDQQLVDRFLARSAGVNLQHLRSRSKLADYEWKRIVNAVGEVSDYPLFIDPTPNITASQMKARIREITIKTGREIGLVGIDYLQLMHSDGKFTSDNQRVANISRDLKLLAREFNIPVICLSQLNRKVEERPFLGKDKKHLRQPMLSDLRDSGSLEQDGDLIIFVYRAEAYSDDPEFKGKALAIVAKQRNGPLGHAKLTWLPEICTFKDRTDDSYRDMGEM